MLEYKCDGCSAEKEPEAPAEAEADSTSAEMVEAC